MYTMDFFWAVLLPLIIVSCLWVIGIVYVCRHPSLWSKLFGEEKSRWILVLRKGKKVETAYQFDTEMTEKEAVSCAEILMKAEESMDRNLNFILSREFKRW